MKKAKFKGLYICPHGIECYNFFRKGVAEQERKKLYKKPFYVSLDEWGQPELFLTKQEALAYLRTTTKGNLRFVKKLSENFWVYVEDSNGEDRYIGGVYLNKPKELKKEIEQSKPEEDLK